MLEARHREVVGAEPEETEFEGEEGGGEKGEVGAVGDWAASWVVEEGGVVGGGVGVVIVVGASSSR